MPPETSTVYDFVNLALAAAGLVVVALYFTLPMLRLWRRAAAGATAWDTPLQDSLLLAMAALLALLFGSVLGASLARFLPGGEAADGPVRAACAQAGGFLGVPFALAATRWYLRTNRTPVAAIVGPGAPRFLEAVGFGVVTFLAAHPFVISAGLVSAKLMAFFKIPPVVQPGIKLLMSDAPPGVRVAMVLTAVVLAPIAEELLFRVGLYRYLRARLPRWAALTCAAAIFAAAHFNLSSALPLFALGLVWAHAYDKTGSPVVNIVAHGLFNLLSIALVLGGYAPVS